MPTYDYECQACNHHFERWQEMSARKLRTCPECGKRKLVRLVGAGAGVIFRGSGFYETDYKRKQSKPTGTGTPSSSSSDGSSSDGSSSDGSSATTPKSKPESKSDGAASSSKASGESGAKSGPSGS